MANITRRIHSTLEDSLDGMKDVVRKKLGLSTSIPVHLSQIRDGKSVDLEDGLSCPAHSEMPN